MLDDLLLRKALELADEGPHDQQLIAVLQEKFRQPDPLSLMRHRSHRFTDDLLNLCGITGLVPRMREWLDDMPPVWIPRQRFLLAAVTFNGRRFIAVSHGFQDVLVATAEFLTTGIVLADAQAFDATWRDKDRLYQSVFLRVLASQVEGTGAHFLPHVIDEMPERLRVATHFMAFLARLFGVLHEIGHFELGHLRSPSSRVGGQTMIRLEDAPVLEDANEDIALEYDADTFAAKQMPTHLQGAEVFFMILSILHATRRYRGVTHPHFANRVANIRKVYGGDTTTQSNFGRRVVSLEAIAAGSDFMFADDELFADIRRRLPHMPEEAVPAMWLNDFQTQLIDEVKAHPDRYPDWSEGGRPASPPV